MELLEQVRVDLEQIQGGRIGQRRRLHEAEQQKQIVQLRRLLAHLQLVAAERGALQDIGEALPILRELFVPVHRPTMILMRNAVPPRSFSSNSREMPPVPRISSTDVWCTSRPSPTHRMMRTSAPARKRNPRFDTSTSSPDWEKSDLSL